MKVVHHKCCDSFDLTDADTVVVDCPKNGFLSRSRCRCQSVACQKNDATRKSESCYSARDHLLKVRCPSHKIGVAVEAKETACPEISIAMAIYKRAKEVRVSLPKDVAQPGVHFFFAYVCFYTKSYGRVKD